MNIQDYISSGIIETYAMGLAGEEEARELEQLCLEYPEIKISLEEAETALEKYALLNAIAPPEPVKAHVWSVIQDQQEVKQQEQIIKPTNEVSKLYSYLSIAAALFIVVGIPYHFYKMNQYKSEISTLKKEKIEILAQNKTFQARIQQASEEVNILSNTSTKNILLAGVAGHEDKKATLYWSNSGAVYVVPTKLALLPEDKQYQLWAIVNGIPVNAGLLEQKELRLQKMISIAHAEMFAITIEKRGGSAQPTLNQMVVAGKPSP